jgi:hypothetical protein
MCCCNVLSSKLFRSTGRVKRDVGLRVAFGWLLCLAPGFDATAENTLDV